jgi:hypothetical protein
MTDAIQFKEGDTVSLFEGTYHVCGRRSTKFIGRVTGFDTETNLWKVVGRMLTLAGTKGYYKYPRSTRRTEDVKLGVL